MASSMSLLVFAMAAMLAQQGFAAQLADLETDVLNASDAYLEQINDEVGLFQTDLLVHQDRRSKLVKDDSTVCRTSASSSGNEAGLAKMLKKIWQWVTQADQQGAAANDATEAAKRFHKDFIAAALLMTCVLPWTRQSRNVADASHRPAQNRLWHLLPSSQSLRYLSVLLLWLKHYWFKGDHTFLAQMFVIVGAVFDFVDQHVDCEDDLWKRLGDFVPERFARLFPFYAFYVIVCYLTFFSSPCSAIETLLGGNLTLAYACGLGAWLLSVVFGCYLVAVVLASPPQHAQASNVAMLCAGCVAMVFLPRTLAAPVHGPWGWSEDKASLTPSDPAGAAYELFFARRSLLFGLVHFFFGLVLARARLLLKSCYGAQSVCKGQELEMASRSTQDGQDTGKPDVDLWKAFEDEARRDMIRSLSVNKPAEHTNNGYSMSPRSNHSD